MENKNVRKKIGSPPETINSLIFEIEKLRKSKVIIYCTGEKQPVQLFGAQIASDTLPLFREILENIGSTNRITLILQTNGGHLETPWPLVNLIREYCKYFEVIVLEKALSAGTLISLGADKIVMLPYSQLSPIDPSADFPDGSKQPKHLEVENITGFIEFAKNKIGINEQSSLPEIMKELTKEISPTMLGSVNRTHYLIRKLSKKLLNLHVSKLSEKQINEITENLTEKMYSHLHLINRKEAKNDIGLNNVIEFTDDGIKKYLDKILLSVNEILETNKSFNPVEILKSNNEVDLIIVKALIYSSEIKLECESTHKVAKFPDPSGNPQIKVTPPLTNEWIKR